MNRFEVPIYDEKGNRYDKSIMHILKQFPSNKEGENGDQIIVKYNSNYYYGRKVDSKWIYFLGLNREDL